MKKLVKIDASCAVCAIKYVSGIDEDTVLRVCAVEGFEAGEGMEDDAWMAAARQLGVRFRRVSLEPAVLSRFIKDHPKGLYFVGTVDHLFVIDNGIIFDPRCANPPGLKRTITSAWRVLKRT